MSLLPRGLSALFALICIPAFAYEPSLARNNLASELVNCGVYFVFAAEAIDRHPAKRPQGQASVERYQSLSVTALTLAGELTNVDVTKARMQMAKEAMGQDMKGTFDNFAIVIAKYATPCKELMEAPERRFQYWLDKK